MNIINIKDYYEPVKENCLMVFKTGSCQLSYLDFYRDIDYVFLYDTEEHAKEAKKKFKTLYSLKDLNTEQRIDIHFQNVGNIRRDVWGMHNEIEVIIDNRENKTDTPTILEDKKRYINIIKEAVKDIKWMCGKSPRIDFYNRKQWYYIYRINTILKNNSYELTDEQKRIINMLHNRKEEEKEMRKQIIDNLIQEVESWPL